jgi:hypothetical protein
MGRLLDWLFGRRKETADQTYRVEVSFNDKPKRDDDYVPKWHSYDVPYGKEHRPAGMVTLAGATDITVAGTSFRLQNCAEFIKAAVAAQERSGAQPALEVHRQPDNPGHPNSLAVYGVLRDGRKWHLGYVPTEISGVIANDWEADMPLAAELRRFGLSRTDEAVFFAMNILIPAAKERKRYAKVAGG